MLELSAASTSQSSSVTRVTTEPCTASTSQFDDVLDEHITTNVNYEHCQNHYSSLSNTDQLQYDRIQLTEPPTISNKHLTHSDVTKDASLSLSTATSCQNRHTPECHADSAPATVESYLTVLADDTHSGALSVNTQQSENAILQASNELYNEGDINVLYRKSSTSNESDQILTTPTYVSETRSSHSRQQSSEATQLQTSPNDYDYIRISGRGGWMVVSVVVVALVVVISIFTCLYFIKLKDGLFKQNSKKVTARFNRTINIYEKIAQSTKFLSVLDGAMLLGGQEELYVYNVTDEQLIYSYKTQLLNTDSADYKHSLASVLVGNYSLASLSKNGHLKTISFKTSQTVSSKWYSLRSPTSMSYAPAHNIIYVTSENYGTCYTKDFGRNWIYLFGSSLNSSLHIAAVRSSTVASSALAATVNGTLTAFWSIEFSTNQKFMSVYVVEETTVQSYFSVFWQSDIPCYHNTVQRNEVNLPNSLNLSYFAQLVDDGRGNAFVVDRDPWQNNATSDIHWLWMTDTYQGQYGGVLLTREQIGVFYSIAVDNGLLYVGHDSYVSVFQLNYRPT